MYTKLKLIEHKLKYLQIELPNKPSNSDIFLESTEMTRKAKKELNFWHKQAVLLLTPPFTILQAFSKHEYFIKKIKNLGVVFCLCEA